MPRSTWAGDVPQKRERYFYMKKGSQSNTCRKGHVFTEETCYTRPNGERECRVCKAETKKLWRLDNADKHRASSAKWQLNNSGRARMNKKKWSQLNEEAVRLHRTTYRHSRRLRLQGSAVDSSKWKALVESFAGFCPYCSSWGHELTLDHILPVSSGGDNHIDNLMPCCFRCNTLKGAKPLQDWLPEFVYFTSLTPKPLSEVPVFSRHPPA